jgi:nicotinate-nucleotide adenylyltransferase
MEPDRPGTETGGPRIGIFGGSFDPVHNGHLAVVSHVRQTFGLEEVHLVLSSSPPHKRENPLAPARDRMAMLRESVSGMPGMVASDVELRRSGLSFTIDTIEHFLALPGAGGNLFFILGSDAFADMGTWKRTREIFRLASLIVMKRPDAPLDRETMVRSIRTMTGETCRVDPASGALVHPDLKPVYLCRVPAMPVSSTEIRKLIRQGCPVSHLGPGPVEAIIREKGLYR